jgi:hypothetical protein
MWDLSEDKVCVPPYFFSVILEDYRAELYGSVSAMLELFHEPLFVFLSIFCFPNEAMEPGWKSSMKNGCLYLESIQGSPSPSQFYFWVKVNAHSPSFSVSFPPVWWLTLTHPFSTHPQMSLM